VIPRRLNCICRRFGKPCLFHLNRQVGACRIYTHLPACEVGTERSETSAYKIQTPGNRPKESIQYTGHGESLKSTTIITYCECVFVAFGTQHPKRMHRVTLSSVACPDVPYFLELLHKCHDYREKRVNEHKMCEEDTGGMVQDGGCRARARHRGNNL